MKVIRISQVVNMTGVGRSTLYRWISEGQFPQQVNLGPASVGWLEQEVLAWIAERMCQRAEVNARTCSRAEQDAVRQ